MSPGKAASTPSFRRRIPSRPAARGPVKKLWTPALGELAWILPLLAGSAGLAWHPWGLILLLGSVGVFLFQRSPWRAGAGLEEPLDASLPRVEAGQAARIGAYACLGAALACGAGLGRFFSKHSLLTADDWHTTWALAGFAFACLVVAGLLLPSGRPKSAKPSVRPPRADRTAGPAASGRPLWRVPVFWAGCLLAALGLPHSPALGALGLSVALVCAPEPTPPSALPRRPGPGRAFWITLAVLAFLSLFFHVWELGTLPQGINHEEGVTMSLADGVQAGWGLSFVYADAAFSGVTLYQHLVGWLFRCFQQDYLLPLRALSVLGWLVLAVYGSLLATELFSGWAALGTLAYAGLSFACIHYGRFGFYYIWTPAMAAAALAHAAWALNSRRSTLHFILCGAWCALAVYGWESGFIIPVLPLVYWAAALGFKRRAWKALAPGLVCGLTAFLALGAAGLAAYLSVSGGPAGLLFQGNSGAMTGMDTLSGNLLGQWTGLFVTGTNSAMHFLPGLPFVEVPVAFFSVAGLALLLRRPWGARGLTLLAACFLGLLPAWISNSQGMNFGRLILLLLPLGLLFGLGWSTAKADLGGLPVKGLGLGLGLAVLALALGREPYRYFHDYQADPAAVAANHGAQAVMARAFVKGRRPEEVLCHGESYDDATSLVMLMPPGTWEQPWRDAPDVLGLFCSYPAGRYLGNALREDWLPWLRAQEPGLVLQEIDNPWGVDRAHNRLGLKSLGSGNVMAISLIWKGDAPKAGLRRTGPGRWQGLLWPSRTDDWRIRLASGNLLLAGKIRVQAGRERGLRLYAVPYSVQVTGSPGDPGLSVTIPRDSDHAEWSTPLFHDLDVHGLRKTLWPYGAKPGGESLVSLVPVVSQSFDLWSFEPKESLLGLPMQGDWEGTVRVPVSGSYRFTVPNTFGLGLALSLGGRVVFSSVGGEGIQKEPISLKAGRAVPLRIHADQIPGGGALRFLVEGPGLPKQVVPTDWLDPAPLPPPRPEEGEHAQP